MLTKLYICVAAALTKSDAQNEKLPNSRITGWDTVRFAVTGRDICSTHFVKILHRCYQCFFWSHYVHWPLFKLRIRHFIYLGKKNIKKGQKSTFTINATFLLKYCWNMVVTAPRTSGLTSLAHFPDQCYKAENQTKKLKNQTFIRPKTDPNSLFLR